MDYAEHKLIINSFHQVYIQEKLKNIFVFKTNDNKL
jgi:hypothetical protein